MRPIRLFLSDYDPEEDDLIVLLGRGGGGITTSPFISLQP